MGKPKMTKADSNGTPRCPHCDGDLWSATITVEDFMTHYPFGGRLSVGEDGYGREGEHLTVECKHCLKPFIVGVNSDVDEWDDWFIKFCAARTKSDAAYMDAGQHFLVMPAS